MKIFCTRCNPEFQVKPEKQALSTHCLCGNVGVLWSIDFNARSEGRKEVVEDRKPIRTNSFDSRYYRIELDDGRILPRDSEGSIPFPYGSEETEEDEDEQR